MSRHHRVEVIAQQAAPSSCNASANYPLIHRLLI